jgi:cyclin-dependent kinase 12/13
MPNNRDENKNGKVTSRSESSPRRGKHKKKHRTGRRRPSRGEVDAGKGPLVEYSDVSSQDLSGPEAGEIQSEDSVSLSEGEVNSPPPAAKKNFDTTETQASRPRSPPPEAPPARHRSPEMPRRRSPIEPPRHRSPVESHSRYYFENQL